MTQIFFKIRSEHENFPSFYDRLAWDLEGQGKVYTPHILVPPNARMAMPIPTEVVVVLDSAEAFETVRLSMLDYLRFARGMELTFEIGDHTTTIDVNSIPEEEALVEKLMPAFDDDDDEDPEFKK